MTRARPRRVVAPILVLALGLVLLAVPAARAQSVRELGRGLQRALESGDHEAATEICGRLGDEGSARAVQILLRVAGEPGVARPVHDAAREALTGVTSGDGVAALVEAMGARRSSWQLKVVVAEALAGKEADGLVEAVADVATGRNTPRVLRRACVAALAGHEDPRAVEALIQCLAHGENERGLLWESSRLALWELTHEAFETAEEWTDWWRSVRDGYEFVDPSEQEGPGTRIREDEERPTFFGREIDSSRVVFVVDTSGSMQMWDPSVEHPADEHEGRPPEARVRIERVKRELISAIEGLAPTTRFTVIPFSSGTRPWESELLPANASNRADAIEYVRSFRAEGGTATDDALEAAFAIEEADTIILLSDGAPMKYGVEARDRALRDQIIEMVDERNRYRGVRIDCLGFAGEGIWPSPGGQRPSSLGDPQELVEFMRTLAEMNGGEFRPIE